jgi:hypothetical protein
MQLTGHDDRQYADGLKALLPTGAAWDWTVGGFGDGLILATAQELARVEVATQLVLDAATALHKPAKGVVTLADYQRVADAATVIIPRKPAAIGHTIGYRLWSNNAPVSGSPDPSPKVICSHLLQPLAIGRSIGDVLWSGDSRYYLRVQFDHSVIDSAIVLSALMTFKQAHVYLYVEDVC